MPSVVQDILNNFSQAGGVNVGRYKENISNMLDAIDRREVPFLNILGWSMDADVTKAAANLKYPCTQRQHEWLNDQLIPNTATLGAAWAGGTGTMTLGSGEANYFYVDEILVLTSGTNTSHYRILSTDTVNDLIVVEPVAGGSDNAHASGTKLYSMGRPALQGETYATRGKHLAPTSDINYTQIFGGGEEGVVAVSGSEQATLAYGVDNRMRYEEAKRLSELAIKLEQATMYGLRSSTLPASNDQPAQRMGGLWYYLQALTGAVQGDGGGGSLSTQENLLLDTLDAVWNAGGKPSLTLMNTFQRRGFNDFGRPFARTTRDERVYGIIINTYVYPHGELNVGLSKWIHPTHLFILSPEYLGIGPLNGGAEDRAFHREDLPKTGDYHRSVVLGEYTMEVRNRKGAHAIIDNLAIS